MVLNIKKIAALIIIGIVFAIIGWVYPIIEFTPTTFINASHINYTGFAAVSGNITDLNDINGSHMLFNESGSPFMINITFTNITSFDYTELKWRYYSTVGASTHVNDIEIWCHTENQFVDIPPTFTNQIEWNYFTKNFPDSMHFIEPNGNVTIRINHSQNGNVNHRLELDTVRLVIKPQYEQINASTNYFNNTTTTGAGCSGNCSFDGIWVNSIRKNNSSDDYGTFINLSSPLKKKSSVFPGMEALLFFNDGEYFLLESTNTTTGVLSRVEGTPEHLTLESTDGSTTNMRLNYNNITTNIDTKTYIQNESEFNFGDSNITQVSSINNRNISISSVISPTLQKNGSIHTQKILTYLNSTGSDITSSQLDNLFGYIFNYNPDIYSQNLITFQTISDGGWNYFQGRKARGTDYGNGTALLSAVKKDDILMRFSAAGYANGTAWTGARTIIDMVASEDWNTTNQGTKIEIWTTSNGSTTLSKRLIIQSNGTITLPSFAGFGNGYVCYDNSGNWYRGTPGC